MDTKKFTEETDERLDLKPEDRILIENFDNKQVEFKNVNGLLELLNVNKTGTRPFINKQEAIDFYQNAKIKPENNSRFKISKETDPTNATHEWSFQSDNATYTDNVKQEDKIINTSNTPTEGGTDAFTDGGAHTEQQRVNSEISDIDIRINAQNQKTEDLKESFYTKKVNITRSPSINPSIDLNGVITEISSLDATYQDEEKSFNFTGTEHISVNQDLDFSNGGTILAELKVDDWESNGRFFANAVGFNPPDGGLTLQLSATNSTTNTRVLVLKSTDNVNIISDDITDIYDSVWIKVAFVLTDTGLVKMYLNGNELNISGTDTVALPNSTNPVVLGNLNNDGSYDRPMLGNLKKVTVLERATTSVEIANWNNGIKIEEAVFDVDFSKKIGDGDNAIYFNDENGDFNTRERLDSNGVLITEAYDSNNGVWVGIGKSVNTSRPSKILYPIGYSTDGWGNGVTKAHLQPLTVDDFEYINTGVDLSTSIGEAFHSLCVAKDWLVQAPQDHYAAVFYNTITSEVKEVDLSAYVRAIPVSGSNFRDKFNGCTTTHGGRYVWLAPSWTTHCVKIDTDTFTIVDDFLINPDHDDAYNGIVATRKYIWCVTHSKEDLARINIETGAITIFPIIEETAGDYNMNESSVANNRSFLGGSDNGDGTIWLHPRRSKYLIKINEETGAIVHKTKHPLADMTNPTWGFFHGAVNINGRIWFTPWGYEKVVWYDLDLDTWGSQDINLTGTQQWCFGATTDGRFIYFPPYKAREIVKVDTLDNSIHTIDCTLAVNAYIAGSTRGFTDGFAGGCVFLDGDIWFSSSLESSYIKMPCKELGDTSTRSNKDLKARQSVISGIGEFYFGSTLRLKKVGSNIEIQEDTGSGFVTVKTL